MTRRMWVPPLAGLAVFGWLLVDLPLCVAGVEVAAVTGLAAGGVVAAGLAWVGRSS